MISQIPLPYSNVGSWTKLYKSYLEGNHDIDYIVCPKPEFLFSRIQYSFVLATFWNKIKSKVFKKRKIEFVLSLDKIIQSNEKYIFQIVDNYGMVKPLHDYLTSRETRKNCYIQFFYHGFSPYTKLNSGSDFYEIVDEIVVLTHDSYKKFKKTINVLPCHFSVLHNGIDTTKFRKVSAFEKEGLRKKLDLENKKVFVWCSQDRPKKGLHIVIEAWRKIYESRQDIILLVIGCDRTENIVGVRFVGRISNDELPQYFQASDCYLFPTLWHEGFGLSLIEALHCGNYCIASAMGGVPEVLHYGKLGKLIENPHFVSEWVDAINDYLDSKFEISVVNEDLYSIKSWRNGMNIIIERAKKRLEIL
nr:glycosyltransferase family 4 protein [Flavobacterium panacis]